MFRRKKRKDSRKARPISAAQVKRGLTIAASVLVFGAAAMVLVVEGPRMQQRLAARTASESLTVVIDWPTSPGASESWLPAEERDRLLAAAYGELERYPDPFSNEGLAAAARALGETGWFEQVSRVRRETGNTVRVEAVWRLPAAVVRSAGVDYLISRRGELLPIAYQPERSPLPAIVGAKFDPPLVNGQLAYGKPWPGADVRAGLDVLTMVNTRPWRGQVAALDVSDYLSGRRLVLVTQWNGRAVWGGAPSDSVPGEVSAEMKLRRLDVLYRQFQRIDARRRIVEVAGPMTLVDDTASASAS
jgi:hypothetical protein